MSGGAGPSGFTSSQLQDLVLKYGNHSAELREAFSALSRRLANTIVPWEDIRAMKAKRLIALNKLPGVRPIGVGEVADRFLGKIMAYVTGDDVRNECNNDQQKVALKEQFMQYHSYLKRNVRMAMVSFWWMLIMLLTQ